jgi:corrinoid protein of di/trimethylamine methyltransferase
MTQPNLAENIFKKLTEAVENGDESAAAAVAKEALDRGVDPAEAIEKGLTKGVVAVGDRWACGGAFITEVMLSAGALKAGLQVLEPALVRGGKTRKTLGCVLLGTVKGDIHDIGKSIVGAILMAAGFEIHDLGVDVPPEKFVEEMPKVKPEIIGLSALLTVSMPAQKEVIFALKDKGLRDAVKVMIGGAPVTEAWAREIGADAYGEDALDAIKKAKTLLGSTEV